VTGVPYQEGNPVVLDFTALDGTTPLDPGTVEFRVLAPDNTLTVYRYGVDPQVTRLAQGMYECALGVPAEPGEYHYDAVTTDPDITAPGDFQVVPSSVVPPPQVPGPVMPPGQTWINGEDLIGLCPQAASLDTQTVDAYAVTASMLMYELSGRQFTGRSGPVTVRPCARQCGGWGPLSGGWLWTWGYWSGDWGYGWAWGNENGSRLCGCGHDSHIDLAGYPVREVTQVKIGGQTLPATFDDGAPTYRLDQWRYLTRLTDPANPDFPLHWPACQRLDLQDDQPGTWSVTYTYGVDPPPAGVAAARQLACQLLLAEAGQPCQLPSNVTQLVRQGTKIERVTPIADALRKGATGLVLVDAFLAAYNPNGLRRRPAISSPDLPYPVRVGNE
jgi:hypothetical protein